MWYNILAGPLRELAPVIGALPQAGGLLRLSGVLATQAEGVADAHRDVFEIDEIAEKRRMVPDYRNKTRLIFLLFGI